MQAPFIPKRATVLTFMLLASTCAIAGDNSGDRATPRVTNASSVPVAGRVTKIFGNKVTVRTNDGREVTTELDARQIPPDIGDQVAIKEVYLAGAKVFVIQPKQVAPLGTMPSAATGTATPNRLPPAPATGDQAVKNDGFLKRTPERETHTPSLSTPSGKGMESGRPELRPDLTATFDMPQMPLVAATPSSAFRVIIRNMVKSTYVPTVLIEITQNGACPMSSVHTFDGTRTKRRSISFRPDHQEMSFSLVHDIFFYGEFLPFSLLPPGWINCKYEVKIDPDNLVQESNKLNNYNSITIKSPVI